MQSSSFKLLDKVGVTLSPSKLSDSVVVIIDVQGEYLPDGKVPLHNVMSAVENCENLLERARNSECPIVHVIHHGTPGEGFYDPQTKGGEFINNVRPLEGEHIVKKKHINAFIDTDIAKILEKTQRKSLIVVGFMTHMCVDTFVRAASDQYGYQVTVVADCTATRDLPDTLDKKKIVSAENVQSSTLSALSDYFACVVDGISEIND